MHEQLLGQTAWPNPTVCRGLLLRPYSLGHEVRLYRLANPLGSGARLVTPLQLDEAVFVCHQTWAETIACPFDPLMRLKMRLWKRRARKTVFKDELRKFIQYRQAADAEFPPTEVDKGGSSSEVKIAGCPLALRLQQWLMLTFRLTEAEAWDYPLGMAKLRWGCYWEEQGGWSIYNEAEGSFDSFVREQEAKGEHILAADARTMEAERRLKTEQERGPQ